MCRTLIWLFLLLAVVSCRKDDIRTAAVHVPAMQSEECAQIIKTALAREQTIKKPDIDVSLESRMIFVKYNSLHRSVKNIEFTVAHAGFDANEVPADPEARQKLPDACRPGAPE